MSGESYHLRLVYLKKIDLALPGKLKNLKHKEKQIR
jgi:hypothetical protein